MYICVQDTPVLKGNHPYVHICPLSYLPTLNIIKMNGTSPSHLWESQLLQVCACVPSVDISEWDSPGHSPSKDVVCCCRVAYTNTPWKLGCSAPGSLTRPTSICWFCQLPPTPHPVCMCMGCGYCNLRLYTLCSNNESVAAA